MLDKKMRMNSQRCWEKMTECGRREDEKRKCFNKEEMVNHFKCC